MKRRPADAPAFLDSIVENIPDMVFVKDARQLRFVLFNKAGERLLGYSRKKLLGKNDYDFFPKAQADHFTAKDREVLERRGLLDIPEEPIQTKNGPRVLHTKKIAVRDKSGRPAFLLGISEDITARKELEEALRQKERQLHASQKMEAVGRLAGGVAHEFNNILTGIVSLAGLIRDDAGTPASARADAEQIVESSRRAAAIITRLRTFSRQRERVLALVDLNDIVSRNERLLRAMVGGRVRLEISTTPSLPPVLADADELDQVLVNLCLNARDAISGTGTITVSTCRPSRARACLCVQDTGSGIAPEHQARVFEPFFTTKKSGEGSGLGLATAYGIVKAVGGKLEFDSVPGRTTFRMTLPARRGKAPSAPRPQADGRPRGTETLLLADDEPIVRSSLAKTLRALGYRVLEAADGRQAVRVFRAHRREIDLALLDVVMPVLDGPGAGRRIAALEPRAKILFMTGYAPDAAQAELRRSGAQVLSKPFSPDELARRIRRALDVKRA